MSHSRGSPRIIADVAGDGRVDRVLESHGVTCTIGEAVVATTYYLVIHDIMPIEGLRWPRGHTHDECADVPVLYDYATVDYITVVASARDPTAEAAGWRVTLLQKPRGGA